MHENIRDQKSDPFFTWSQMESGLAAKSIAKYQFLWRAWERWLREREMSWRSPTGATIVEFLSGPIPSQNMRCPAKIPGKMSEYTRQRYWRLISGVYACAFQCQLIDSDPVQQVPSSDRPVMRNRESPSIENQMLDYLRDPHVLRDTIKVKSPHAWWQYRDRAMVALLADTGITCSELSLLKGIDLFQSNVDVEYPALWKQENDSPALFLNVTENGQRCSRILPISSQAASVLMEWVDARAKALKHSATISMPSQLSESFLTQQCGDGALFFARKNPVDLVADPIDAVTIYSRVSRVLSAIRQRMNLRTSSATQRSAKGAAAIRTAVIQRWIEDVGEDKALELSGLQSFRKFSNARRVRGTCQ